MSFKYRFILSFVFLETVFILLIVGINFFTIQKNLEDYIEDEIRSSKYLLIQLVKAPVSIYDLATLDNVVETAKKLTNIKHIIIIDNDEKILTNSANNSSFNIDLKKYKNTDFEFEETINNRRIIITTSKIYNDNVKLGDIFLFFDVTEKYNEITENKSNTYFLILFEIFISTIVAYMIGRSLTYKLMDLAEVVKRIGQNKKALIPFLSNKSEIGILAKSMQKMQNDINHRNHSLRLYAEIFENTQEAIAITDAHNRVIDINSAFEKITLYKRDELINKSLKVLKSGKYNDDFYKNMWNEITDKGYWSGEIIDKKKDGKFFTAILSISSIKNEMNQTINYVAVWTDITYYKEQDRIFRVQSKLATMGEMLNNIAHQWRQPLSGISTLASGVLMKKQFNMLSDEEFEKSMNNVVGYCNYLSNTIDDFRNFFKSDEKLLVNFDLSELIKKDLQMLESMFNSNFINLIPNVEEGIKIFSYKNELLQCLLNIINNAKDALQNSNNAKYLFIDAYKEKNDVVIIIKDNAGGIPEDILDKIFEPYFTTKHQSHGTGIGLYMTHIIIVDHMKGSISVNNSEYEYMDKEFKGAMFKIRIPIDINE